MTSSCTIHVGVFMCIVSVCIHVTVCVLVSLRHSVCMCKGVGTGLAGPVLAGLLFFKV